MVFCNCAINNRHIETTISHNPYFNRWFSAIRTGEYCGVNGHSHNPYFNRWFSAIPCHPDVLNGDGVTILILIDGFLQLYCA